MDPEVSRSAAGVLLTSVHFGRACEEARGPASHSDRITPLIVAKAWTLSRGSPKHGAELRNPFAWLRYGGRRRHHGWEARTHACACIRQ